MRYYYINWFTAIANKSGANVTLGVIQTLTANIGQSSKGLLGKNTLAYFSGVSKTNNFFHIISITFLKLVLFYASLNLSSILGMHLPYPLNLNSNVAPINSNSILALLNLSSILVALDLSSILALVVSTFNLCSNSAIDQTYPHLS
jgi:hypothetical protein